MALFLASCRDVGSEHDRKTALPLSFCQTPLDGAKRTAVISQKSDDDFFCSMLDALIGERNES